MTDAEIKVTYDALKKEGFSKEALFCATCKMFIDLKIEIEELRNYTKMLGFLIDESILNYNPEEQISIVNGYIKSFAEKYDLKEFKEDK